MKQIVRYCLTALLVLGGCTNETEMPSSGSSPSGTDTGEGTPLVIRATAGGFIHAGQPGDSPATRTPVEDGLATKFQPGDAIGLFCVRTDEHTNEYISEDIKNLKLVYAQTSDGTGIWTTEEGTDGPICYTDAQAYVAYSPYNAKLGTNARNEEQIREILRMQIEPMPDQSTLEKYAAYDLMIASATPVANVSGQRTLTLNFEHEYALVVVKPMAMNPCIPPSGVTAYSYHAEAREWGIDKNVVLLGGDDFKMKINNGKACEMSDGTYRILRVPTTSSSQIACEYVTFDLGLLPVTATGSSISGGFQSNTCYTLEVRCKSAIGSAAERTLQPGDFVYQHNGKIEIYPGDGAVDASGKIPEYEKAVGIVVTCDPARMTDEGCAGDGWTHAYVMGTETYGSNLQWAKENWKHAELEDVTTITQAKNYMNGCKDTKFLLSIKVDDYEIFYKLYTYRKNNPIPSGVNRSPWFIPSTGQWYDLITNIGGKSPDAFNNNTEAGWSSNQDGTAILGEINARLNKIGKSLPNGVRFPCSTEPGYGAWMVKFNGNTVEFGTVDKTLKELSPLSFFAF